MSGHMTDLRVKIKYGIHEFEAEGSVDAVERQVEAFKHFVEPPPVPPPAPEQSIQEKASEPLEKLLRVQGRVVSLTTETNVSEGVLEIMLGYRRFLNMENVSGREIMEGLRKSGFRIPRADSILAKHAKTGLVITWGKQRNRRYRLTTDGILHAEQIARALITKALERESTAR